MSLIHIINELTVSSIEDSLKFYQTVFNFEIEFTYGKPTWIQLKKDKEKLMLEDFKTVTGEIKSFPEKTNNSNLLKFEYDNLDEFESLYNNCKKNMCSFFMDYNITDYGKIEFGVLDPDKNMIIVSYEK